MFLRVSVGTTATRGERVFLPSQIYVTVATGPPSVCEAYKKIYGKELEDEEFYTMSNLDIYEICQNLCDCCVLGAIDDLYDFRNNRLGGFDDED